MKTLTLRQLRISTKYERTSAIISIQRRLHYKAIIPCPFSTTSKGGKLWRKNAESWINWQYCSSEKTSLFTYHMKQDGESETTNRMLTVLQNVVGSGIKSPHSKLFRSLEPPSDSERLCKFCAWARALNSKATDVLQKLRPSLEQRLRRAAPTRSGW